VKSRERERGNEGINERGKTHEGERSKIPQLLRPTYSYREREREKKRERERERERSWEFLTHHPQMLERPVCNHLSVYPSRS